MLVKKSWCVKYWKPINYYMQRAVWAASKQHDSNVFVFVFSAGENASSRSSLIYSQYHDCKIFWHRWPQLQIYCKLCGFMRNLLDPKGLFMHSQFLMYLKRKIQSKRFRVVRACALKKQATQTWDCLQSFHNMSTKVSSVTRVYVQRWCVWLRMFSCGFFFFFFYVCHFVLKCK